MHKPAIRSSRETFPKLRERIGEDPARYLDRDILGSSRGIGESDLFASRLRGIDRLEVINAWIAVERRLDRGPRAHILDRLEDRKETIEAEGERDLPGRSHEELVALSDDGDDEDEEETIWRHEKCGSIDVERESARAWFCNECEERTNRVEEVDETDPIDDDQPAAGRGVV